jgi:hypothetical protein
MPRGEVKKYADIIQHDLASRTTYKTDEVNDLFTIETTLGSIGIGSSLTNSGSSTLALGNSPSVQGNDSIAIGSSSLVSGTSSVAIGPISILYGPRNVAIGLASSIGTIGTPVDNNIAIGYGALVQGSSSIAIGPSCSVQAGFSSGLALGTNCDIQGNSGIAIGTSVNIIANNSGMISTNNSSSSNTVANTFTWRVANTNPQDLSLREGVLEIMEYTVIGVPAAANSRAGFSGIIVVTNETGGRTLATSDGTNWRRVSDGAIIS